MRRRGSRRTYFRGSRYVTATIRTVQDQKSPDFPRVKKSSDRGVVALAWGRSRFAQATLGPWQRGFRRGSGTVPAGPRCACYPAHPVSFERDAEMSWHGHASHSRSRSPLPGLPGAQLDVTGLDVDAEVQAKRLG